MNRIKEVMKERVFTRYAIFIICTFSILYLIYYCINHIPVIVPALAHAFMYIKKLLNPLIIGLVLAYMINPLVNFVSRKTKLEKKKKGRLLSVVLTYIIILAAVIFVLYGFMALIMGHVVFDSLSKLVGSLISKVQVHQADILHWAQNLPYKTLSNHAQSYIENFAKWLSSSFNPSSFVNTATSVGGGIANLLIGLIMSIYLVIDDKYFVRIWNKSLDVFLPQKKEPINDLLHEIDFVLSKFIRGIVIDAFIVAILSSVALSILGLKFAVFIGIFAGICNVIPYFGPILGMIPAFTVGALTSGPMTGIIAVLILFIIQQIDGNLIYPKVVGDSTGLHPLFVLLAVTVGGGVAGLFGMVVAVPISGILKILLKKWIDKKQGLQVQ